MNDKIKDLINEEMNNTREGNWVAQEDRKNPLSYEEGGINIKIYIDGKTNGMIYDKIKNPFAIKHKIIKRTKGAHVSFEVYDDLGLKNRIWYEAWKNWWVENKDYYNINDDEWIV